MEDWRWRRNAMDERDGDGDGVARIRGDSQRWATCAEMGVAASTRIREREADLEAGEMGTGRARHGPRSDLAHAEMAIDRQAG